MVDRLQAKPAFAADPCVLVAHDAWWRRRNDMDHLPGRTGVVENHFANPVSIGNRGLCGVDENASEEGPFGGEIVVKMRSLQDLGAMRDALARAEREAAEAARRAAEEKARLDRERRQFELAVGIVRPLKAAPRADLRPEPPLAWPRQKELDEARALAEAMSDEVDVESLLLTDDGLGFRRPGVSLDVLGHLRKGKWAIQDQLDLHGLRRDEAREAVGTFLRNAEQRGLRCLRVIHGKGHGSPGREPVLKSKVHKWLAQRREVIAFAQAAGPQGGAGAVIVLLAA